MPKEVQNEIEKEYRKLKEKYKLPEYSELNEEFEISSLECTDFLLRNIRRRMIEKISVFSSFIDELVQPEPNFRSITELSVIAQNSKDKAFGIYKDLIFADRASLELDVESTDEKEAEFIINLLKKWKETKPELLLLLAKVKGVWKKDITSEKEELGYVG